MMNPITGMVTDLSTGRTTGPYVSSTTSPGYVPGTPTGTGALTSITSPLFQPGIGVTVAATSTNATGPIYAFSPTGQSLWGFQSQQILASNYGGLIPAQVPTTPLTASQALVRSEFMTNSVQLPIPGVGTPGAPGGYASYFQPEVVDQSIYNSQTGPNYDATDYTQSRRGRITLTCSRTSCPAPRSARWIWTSPTSGRNTTIWRWTRTTSTATAPPPRARFTWTRILTC